MKFDNKEQIFYLGRYRDDGFMIYHGNESEIHNFFEIANSHHPLLKFTYEISNTNMIFLDTTVYKGSRFAQYGILDFKSHIKATNSLNILKEKALTIHLYLKHSSKEKPFVTYEILSMKNILPIQ